MRLLEFSKNIYSQTGEDGVLLKALETLTARDKWCVEFGAWDGQHLSNTFNLIKHHGYSGVLIEGDAQRFNNLRTRFADEPRVMPVNCFVGFSAEDGLDKILANTPIPRDFDLLSIDIDGNDYHVWEAIRVYRPKIVCIEYNPTIPTEIDFVQAADPSVNQGASLSALTSLGRRKDYSLIAVTPLNGIFVRSELLPLFGIEDNSPRALREDTSSITHIFCGYDGTIFYRGHGSLAWHEIKYSSRIRQLPRIFRGYPGNFGRLKFLVFRAYRKFLRKLERSNF